MKSVFLVKTPLQLLNAIEAKYFFDLNSNDCVLIVMGDRKSQPQLLKLAAASDEWGDLLILNDVNLFFGDVFSGDNKTLLDKISCLNLFKRSFFNVRRLNRISRQLHEVKYIFVGYVKYIYMKHFVNIMPHEKVFLLDDGNATIQLSRERRLGVIETQATGIKKKLKLYSKRLFQGVKDKDQAAFNFFTMYDISAAGNDQIIKNNFQHIRSNSDLLSLSDDVYFIGSPISEVGIISQESYFLHLQRVQKYFSGRKIIYIAHRREQQKKLDMIKNNFNLEVVLFDYPIEYQLSYIGPRPVVLASFISSALDSCRIIFDEKLKIISFKMDLSESPMRNEIEPIYDSYTELVNDNFILESDY